MSRTGQLMSYIPHCKALGIEMIEREPGNVLMRVPYAAHLVGNPTTGVIHGGVITAILDNAAGQSVHSTMDARSTIATLDLRVDYMRPAARGEAVYAQAECYRKTRNVAFVRGSAFHSEPADPIATMTATFMLASDQTRSIYGSSKAGGEPDASPSDVEG